MTGVLRVRRVVNSFLIHRYTRVPMSGGTEDTWKDIDEVPGTGVTGQKCQYSVKDTYVKTDEGTIVVKTPTLTVLWNDPVSTGDLVKDVVTRGGQVLLVGPAVVETVDPVAELGESVEKILTLRVVEVEP